MEVAGAHSEGPAGRTLSVRSADGSPSACMTGPRAADCDVGLSAAPPYGGPSTVGGVRSATGVKFDARLAAHCDAGAVMPPASERRATDEAGKLPCASLPLPRGGDVRSAAAEVPSRAQQDEQSPIMRRIAALRGMRVHPHICVEDVTVIAEGNMPSNSEVAHLSDRLEGVLAQYRGQVPEGAQAHMRGLGRQAGDTSLSAAERLLAFHCLESAVVGPMPDMQGVRSEGMVADLAAGGAAASHAAFLQASGNLGGPQGGSFVHPRLAQAEHKKALVAAKYGQGLAKPLAYMVEVWQQGPVALAYAGHAAAAMVTLAVTLMHALFGYLGSTAGGGVSSVDTSASTSHLHDFAAVYPELAVKPQVVAAQDRPPPVVDVPAMVAMHKAFPCDACKSGECDVERRLAPLGGAFFLLDPAKEKRIKRPPSEGTGDDAYYPGPPSHASHITQEDAVRAAGGVAEPCPEQPKGRVRRFAAARTSCAPKDGAKLAALDALPPQEFAEEAQQRVDRAISAALQSSDAPSSADMAIAFEAAHDPENTKLRTVWDYTESRFNGALGPWHMSMATVGLILSMLVVGCYIASVDLESGFWHVPMHKSMRLYSAYWFAGRWWQPTRLMFGSKWAPAIFSSLTAEVVATVTRIVRAELGASAYVVLIPYIDDIFIIAGGSADNRELCARALNILEKYCAAVGIRLNSGKTRQPACEGAPCLGSLVSSTTLTVSLPVEKRFSYLVLVRYALACLERGWRFPMALYEKLVGKLTWAAGILGARGAANVQALWDAKAAAKGGPVAIAPGDHAYRALKWWEEALRSQAGCTAQLIPSPSSPLPYIRVFSRSDASGAGPTAAGGVAVRIGPVTVIVRVNRALLMKGSSDEKDWVSIGALELMGPMLPLLLFPDQLRNAWLFPILDNLPDAFAVLNGRTKDRDARVVLQAMLEVGAAHNVTAVSSWLPREDNGDMDAASKRPVQELTEEAEAAAVAAGHRIYVIRVRE